MQPNDKKEWKWHGICLGSLLLVCFGLFFLLSHFISHSSFSHRPAARTITWTNGK